MPENEKKGITVKVDAALHAEVRRYIEAKGMTMAEFVALALNNELHPKLQPQEVKNMGNTRTIAFQVPEEMYQRIKDYLHNHHMTQKEFFLGLISAELDRDMQNSSTQAASDNQENGSADIADEYGEFASQEDDENLAPDENESESESEDDSEKINSESEEESEGYGEDEAESEDDTEELDDESEEDTEEYSEDDTEEYGEDESVSMGM